MPGHSSHVATGRASSYAVPNTGVPGPHVLCAAEASEDLLVRSGNVAYTIAKQQASRLGQLVDSLKTENRTYRTLYDELVTKIPVLLGMVPSPMDSISTTSDTSEITPAPTCSSRVVLGLNWLYPEPPEKPADVIFKFWHASLYKERPKNGHGKQGPHDEKTNVGQRFVEDKDGQVVSGAVAKEIRETLRSLLHSLVWSGQAAHSQDQLMYEARVYLHVMLARRFPFLLLCEGGAWKINELIKQMYSGFSGGYVKNTTAHIKSDTPEARSITPFPPPTTSSDTANARKRARQGSAAVAPNLANKRSKSNTPLMLETSDEHNTSVPSDASSLPADTSHTSPPPGGASSMPTDASHAPAGGASSRPSAASSATTNSSSTPTAAPGMPTAASASNLSVAAPTHAPAVPSVPVPALQTPAAVPNGLAAAPNGLAAAPSGRTTTMPSAPTAASSAPQTAAESDILTNAPSNTPSAPSSAAAVVPSAIPNIASASAPVNASSTPSAPSSAPPVASCASHAAPSAPPAALSVPASAAASGTPPDSTTPATLGSAGGGEKPASYVPVRRPFASASARRSSRLNTATSGASLSHTAQSGPGQSTSDSSPRHSTEDNQPISSDPSGALSVPALGATSSSAARKRAPKGSIVKAQTKYRPDVISEQNLFMGRMIQEDPDVSHADYLKAFKALSEAEREELKKVCAQERKNRDQRNSAARAA